MAQNFLPELFDLDVYQYAGGFYVSFKDSTDEKILTGLMQREFNKILSRKQLAFKNDETRVFDMGCGPCDTSLHYYLSSGFKTGKLVVRAVDENAQYVGGTDLATSEFVEASASDAYKNAQTARRDFAARAIQLDFAAKQGDAFSGNSIANASHECDTAMPNSFDLAFLSHLFYHVAPKNGKSSADRLDGAIGDIAKNTLKGNGLAIAYHVAIGGKDDNYSFQYFRDNFGSSSAAKQRKSDTDAMDTKDPATKIEESCAKQGIGCRTLRFDTKLRFSSKMFGEDGLVKNEVREIFKDPARYNELLIKPELYDDLMKIYFIIQRSANELAADKSHSGLSNFMDEFFAAIEKTRDDRGHYLITHEKMQLITNPAIASDVQRGYNDALDELVTQLPALEAEASRQFFARGAARAAA